MKTYENLSLHFLFTLALTIVSGAWGIWLIYDMTHTNSRVMVIADGCYLLAVLYLFGLSFSFTFSGAAANTLTDFLFYPKHFLKKAPPVLSRQQGLIKAGLLEQAEVELIEERQKYKSSPELALMLAELHAIDMQNPAGAVADCRFYFAHRSWRYHELNLHIALRYADWQVQLGNHAEARKQLLRDARAGFYPAVEKKSLLARAESLRNEFSEK